MMTRLKWIVHPISFSLVALFNYEEDGGMGCCTFLKTFPLFSWGGVPPKVQAPPRWIGHCAHSLVSVSKLRDKPCLTPWCDPQLSVFTNLPKVPSIFIFTACGRWWRFRQWSYRMWHRIVRLHKWLSQIDAWNYKIVVLISKSLHAIFLVFHFMT